MSHLFYHCSSSFTRVKKKYKEKDGVGQLSPFTHFVLCRQRHLSNWQFVGDFLLSLGLPKSSIGNCYRQFYHKSLSKLKLLA
mmetsp:Transcript_6910/g.12105  ORF Transcript_6910/g.12105 Transcript_6910/m.12105 type:complete len:82 (+) Transcript_6910:2351-2596(+)